MLSSVCRGDGTTTGDVNVGIGTPEWPAAAMVVGKPITAEPAAEPLCTDTT